MNWLGTVKSIDGTGATVTVPDLGGDFPSLQMVVNFRIGGVETAGLLQGDQVLVTNIGAIKDDLIIVGVVVTPTAPAEAPGASLTWPGWGT